MHVEAESLREIRTKKTNTHSTQIMHRLCTWCAPNTPLKPEKHPSVVNCRDGTSDGVSRSIQSYSILSLHLSTGTCVQLSVALLSRPSFRTVVQGFLEQLNQRQDNS